MSHIVQHKVIRYHTCCLFTPGHPTRLDVWPFSSARAFEHIHSTTAKRELSTRARSATEARPASCSLSVPTRAWRERNTALNDRGKSLGGKMRLISCQNIPFLIFHKMSTLSAVFPIVTPRKKSLELNLERIFLVCIALYIFFVHF